jgi:hypothetical protein
MQSGKLRNLTDAEGDTMIGELELSPSVIRFSK